MWSFAIFSTKLEIVQIQYIEFYLINLIYIYKYNVYSGLGKTVVDKHSLFAYDCILDLFPIFWELLLYFI